MVIVSVGMYVLAYDKTRTVDDPFPETFAMAKAFIDMIRAARIMMLSDKVWLTR